MFLFLRIPNRLLFICRTSLSVNLAGFVGKCHIWNLPVDRKVHVKRLLNFISVKPIGNYVTRKLNPDNYKQVTRDFRRTRKEYFLGHVWKFIVNAGKSMSAKDEQQGSATNVTKKKNNARGKGEWHLRLVWVDLEMTGLDIEKDVIIEMACIITDKDLNIVAEGPDLIIHQDDNIMDNMGDWCKTHHGQIDSALDSAMYIGKGAIQKGKALQSGLTKAVKESNLTLEEAEQKMLAFIKQHVPKGRCPLAGNSVHADKAFLDKYMPNFMKHLHYRIVDVSSVKEIARRWYPNDHDISWKKCEHRALGDILESIRELKQYRASIFK